MTRRLHSTPLKRYKNATKGKMCPPFIKSVNWYSCINRKNYKSRSGADFLFTVRISLFAISLWERGGVNDSSSPREAPWLQPLSRGLGSGKLIYHIGLLGRGWNRLSKCWFSCRVPTLGFKKIKRNWAINITICIKTCKKL